MILTDRDKQLLRHIEQYKFTTIQQATDLFFRDRKYGYDMARKRLNLMVREDKLLAMKDFKSGLNIYSLDKIKTPSPSDILLMDFYCKLITEGCEVLMFEKEYRILDGKIRSDGFCIFKFCNYMMYSFVEVQLRHAFPDVAKYEMLYKSNEFQKQFETDVFPTLIVISDVDYREVPKSNLFNVVQFDHQFNQFAKLFIS